MNCCQKHWDMLREGVFARGMRHLVAKDGEVARDNFVAQVQGNDTVENWDPLMAAWANFGRVALEKAGLAALQPDFCILCEIHKSYDNVMAHPEIMEDETQWPKGGKPWDDVQWIDSCLDAMLRHAREKNLMPMPS